MWVPSLLLVVAGQSVGVPVVTSIDPATVPPYRPVEITVRGEGFEAGCRALLGVQGRLVPVRSDVESASVIRIHLTAGLGPQPSSRRVLVDCGRGRRSGPLTLTVASTPEEDSDISEGETGSEPAVADTDDPSLEAAPQGAPTLVSLDPSNPPAGQPFTLTVMGSSFREGAEVLVLANANAGTSRQPDYRPVPFPSEFASDTVLLVDFDRGFAPSPRLRSVTVVNPDGGRSPPLYLEITRSAP